MFNMKRIKRILSYYAFFILVSTSVVLGQGTPPQEPPAKEWKEVKGPHYKIRTTATVNEGHTLLNYMEAVYQAYTSLFNYTKSIPSVFVVKLYKNREEFYRAGAPRGAAAYYSSDSKELVGYWDKSGEVFSYFAHEGFHQFNHMYFKEAYEKRLIPIWFDEGMSDCLGNSELRGGKLFAGLKNGLLAQGRLRVIQQAIRRNQYYPLRAFIDLDRNTFMGNASLCYPQGWSFCHFLLAYPLKEDKRRIVPAGDYYHVVSRLYEGFTEYATHSNNPDKETRFNSPQDIYNYAFQTKDKKPIELDELEKQWKEYVLKFNEKEGKEKESEEAATAIWEKIVQAYQTNKWNDLSSLIIDLKDKYKTTDIYKYNEFDIGQLSNIAKWNSESKPTPYQLDIFSGKSTDLAGWDIEDIESNGKSWKVENKLLIAEASDSYCIFKKESNLNWSLTTQFKFDKSLPEKTPTQFAVCAGGDANRGYFSIIINPSDLNAILVTYAGGKGSGLGAFPIKEQYKKDDWNEIVITSVPDLLEGYFNGKKLFAAKVRGDLPGKWGLHIIKGKVFIKSVSVKLK